MRLIDADALIDALGISDEDIVFKEILEDAPTIDAVPVVRCNDCKWWDECDELDKNGYCHHGERKDDETD